MTRSPTGTPRHRRGWGACSARTPADWGCSTWRQPAGWGCSTWRRPAGRLDWLVGGTPSQLPDRYAQLSPLHRVPPGCPPTLLIHGQHDEMAPVAAMRQLHQRLGQVGAPVTAVYLPHTDHAFDLLATWSPPARVAIHVLERFLAVLAATDQRSQPNPSAAHLPSLSLPQARLV